MRLVAWLTLWPAGVDPLPPVRRRLRSFLRTGAVAVFMTEKELPLCAALLRLFSFEFVQKVSPILQELDPFLPIFRPVVRSAHLVWVKVSKRSFDNVIVVM